MKQIITKPYSKNPKGKHMKYYLLGKIHNEEIWTVFNSKKEYIVFLKLLEMFVIDIKKAIEQLKSEGIEGNEKTIKKVIYDKWGHSDLDGHGYSI